MDINIKWVIIGAVFVILMVAFGRNPIEDRRDAHKQAREGKDPLIMSIEEYHSESNKHARGTAATSGNGKLPEGAIEVPDYSKPSRNGSMYNNLPAYNQQQNSRPQPQGYYPPPAKGKSSSPRSELPPGFDENQQILFYGTKAYTKDARGKSTPLADGKYPLWGGKLYLVIKNGEKVDVVAGDRS